MISTKYEAANAVPNHSNLTNAFRVLNCDHAHDMCIHSYMLAAPRSIFCVNFHFVRLVDRRNNSSIPQQPSYRTSHTSLIRTN